MDGCRSNSKHLKVTERRQYEELSVRRTCGAGRHTRRMPSELGCSAWCMEKCCLPFMAIIFVAHLAGEWT